ncbi:hypothetical protein ACFL6M_00820 [Candidatus Eisenbacteria bacterium]|uniref:Phytase-like domain-containing protein n=1 Tax=Eiseniibacteriota bacterium TaxID=2212470 RepID=A0ABV6YIE4_UNCEI
MPRATYAAVVAISILTTGLILTPSAADVPRVKNTKAALPPRTVRLEEQWRVGGENSDLLLGTITEATTDPEGNVYLLDTQMCHVEVISPQGEHLRTLSREGDGPGEVRRPRDVVFLPDSTIGLLELFPAKLVKVALDGEPRGSLIVGGESSPQTGFMAASQCSHRGGTFLISGTRSVQSETGQERVMYLAGLADGGEEKVRFCESTMSLVFEKLKFVERELQPIFHVASAVGPDGRVYTPQAWDWYAIEVFAPDGTLERVIEREFENRKRTPQELQRINALYDASDRNTPYKIEREIEPSPPVIAALHVDPEGRLWVLHSRSDEDCPAGVMQAYDLFDPLGVYQQQVFVACDGDPEFDGLTFLSDGRVLLIKGYVLAGLARTDLGSVPLGEEEESAPLEIICCSLAS